MTEPYSYFQNLPTETLVNIFGRLRGRDFYVMKHTCRRFQQIVDTIKMKVLPPIATSVEICTGERYREAVNAQNDYLILVITYTNKKKKSQVIYEIREADEEELMQPLPRYPLAEMFSCLEEDGKYFSPLLMASKEIALDECKCTHGSPSLFQGEEIKNMIPKVDKLWLRPWITTARYELRLANQLLPGKRAANNGVELMNRRAIQGFDIDDEPDHDIDLDNEIEPFMDFGGEELFSTTATEIYWGPESRLTLEDMIRFLREILDGTRPMKKFTLDHMDFDLVIPLERFCETNMQERVWCSILGIQIMYLSQSGEFS